LYKIVDVQYQQELLMIVTKIYDAYQIRILIISVLIEFYVLGTIRYERFSYLLGI